MEKKFRFIKEKGIFYTEEKLANKMIDHLNINYSSDFTIFEPAIGEGHILSIIVEKYLEENEKKSIKDIKIFLENNIAGFDLRAEAVELCIVKLNNIVNKFFCLDVNWNIHKINALDNERLLDYFSSYDYVISNPPYVSRHNMDNDTVIFLKTDSEFCSKFNFDLYYYFFEIALNFWNGKGKIVYITPNSYLKAKSGEKMVKYLIDNFLISRIIDFEDEMLFEGASTYSAITVLSGKNKFLTIEDGNGNNKNEISYNKLIHEDHYKIYSHEFMNEFKEKHVNLGDVAEIRNGLATLQDKVFIFSEEEIESYKDNNLTIKKGNKLYSLESECIKKVYRASKLSKKYYIVFPYENSPDNQRIFSPNLNIENKFPKINEYLKTQLSEEYRLKYDIFFGRAQGFACYYDKKIVIPKVAYLDNEVFKIVEDGFVLAGLSIKLKNDLSDESYNKIKDYLNSDVVLAYLAVTSKNYSSGYKSISSTDLKRIKIPIELL